jgi:hypothetical protein
MRVTGKLLEFWATSRTRNSEECSTASRSRSAIALCTTSAGNSPSLILDVPSQCVYGVPHENGRITVRNPLRNAVPGPSGLEDEGGKFSAAATRVLAIPWWLSDRQQGVWALERRPRGVGDQARRRAHRCVIGSRERCEATPESRHGMLDDESVRGLLVRPAC